LTLSSTELRRMFLSFFRERSHTICPSSPLIASGDPTLLFTAAGMVQFKEYYSSPEPLAFTRAASVQKCLRLSDLDNVGRTLRHHTFFEMLGNFSFGDYFKEETVAWAWEFVVEVLGLPSDRLWVSVYEEDEEARRIWEDKMGLPSIKVISLGKKDNFWGPVGRTGVCGPCSEIYIDLEPGESPKGEGSPPGHSRAGTEPRLVPTAPVIPGIGCGKTHCRPGCECERFLEFWNLVFPQFYKGEEGSLSPLKRKGIDTGMGLERLAMIIQGKKSVFDTDLLRPIVDKIEELLEREIDRHGDEAVAANVIADHTRALAFAIAEGIMPSNEDRGYVLRRLLRRASRRMRTLGGHKPHLHELVGVVIDAMRDAYPELSDKREHIARVTLAEEERFEKTLELGITRFEELAGNLEAAGERRLSGQHVFTLYDTYGFPPDLTKEMARERDFEIDSEGFAAEMEKQRRAAQVKSRFRGDKEAKVEAGRWTVLSRGSHSRFVGYKRLEDEVVLRKFRHSGEPGGVELILNRTPFYAEAGGQVGDVGRLTTETSGIEVTNVVVSGKSVIHRGRVVRGSVEAGTYKATVDGERRASAARNHTATHLLHHALRRVLGDHVRQAGSLVAPDRLRFDYTHFQAPSASELEQVENVVNELVLEDLPVCEKLSSYSEAVEAGAVALFGEKYGQRVRQILIGTQSRELCGGTHVQRTGQIGHFLVLHESAIGSGTRRIEAVTGLEARAVIVDRGRTLQGIKELVGVGKEELLSVVSGLVKARETLERRTHLDEKTRVGKEVERLLAEGTEVSGVKIVAGTLAVGNQDILREAGDILREELKRGAGIIGTVIGDKVLLLAFVGDSLLTEKKLVAPDIAREAARIVGGGGGGRPHMATAGGHDVAALDKALSRGKDFIVERLK